MERDHHRPLLHSMEAVLAERRLIPPPWALQDELHLPRRQVRRQWKERAADWGLDATDDDLAALHDGVRLARLLDALGRGPSARHQTTFGEVLWLTRAHAEYRGVEWFLAGGRHRADLDRLWSSSLIGVAASLTMLETLLAHQIGERAYAELADRAEGALEALCRALWQSLGPLDAFRARREAVFSQ